MPTMMATMIAKQEHQTEHKMKATLTFNLPDDSVEYEYTLNAARYKDALSEIMSMMRKKDKWNEYDGMTAEVVAQLYDEMCEIVDGLELN
jgi:hypothetical protein